VSGNGLAIIHDRPGNIHDRPGNIRDRPGNQFARRT